MNLLTNARDALNERYPEYDEDKIIRVSAKTISGFNFRISDSEGTEQQSQAILNPQSAADQRETGRPEGVGNGVAIRITVEDHGNGIPAEAREHLFDPFFTTKPKESGTGLGLSISHGIVQEHHGLLTIEDEPGEYTRFHLDLPVDNGWDLGEA